MRQNDIAFRSLPALNLTNDNLVSIKRLSITGSSNVPGGPDSVYQNSVGSNAKWCQKESTGNTTSKLINPQSYGNNFSSVPAEVSQP